MTVNILVTIYKICYIRLTETTIVKKLIRARCVAILRVDRNTK